MADSDVARLDLDDDPCWLDIADPPTEGRLSHATYRPTGTVVLVRDGREIALADAFPYHLANQYCYDSEYYLVVRIRTAVPDCPWQPGDVCVAFDTFHDLTYIRDTPSPGGPGSPEGPGSPDEAGSLAGTASLDRPVMSYGGDWDDLQLLVDADHPHPAGPRPTGRVSDATVLRAVRENDLELLDRALAAGGNPNAGFDPPSEATRSVSVDRDTYALAESRSPAITAALLAAGATVDGPGRGLPTPLQLELLRGVPRPDPDLVRLLLHYGANPDAGAGDQRPREVARRLGPAFVALFDR